MFNQKRLDFRNMFYNILDEKRKDILPLFRKLKNKFYLAGGTALALQLGHRDSIDFDFFSEDEFDTRELFEKLKMLRNYGQSSRYHHVLRKSINSRLDEIQASILRTKLKYLDPFNSKRERIADYYRANINNENISIVNTKPFQKSNNHLFVIKHKKRDLLMNYLNSKGVQTLIHYPIPINKQKAFPFQKDEVFINSEMFASQILSLPIYPELNIKDVENIVYLLNKFDE